MGWIAAFLGAVLSSSKDLVSKQLASRLDGTASTFASFTFALPFYLGLLCILFLAEAETFSYSLVFFGLVLLRSLTDSLAEGLKMHAFSHGDISVVSTFFSLAPLFLLFTSPLITGDPLSVWQAIAVILVVLGSVALVYRPSSRGWGEQKKGIVLAVCAAVFFSLNSCFDRLAVAKGTPVFAGFAMTLLSALILYPFVVFSRARIEAIRLQQSELWLRGLMETTFMVCKLTALQYLDATEVVGLMRISLLFSIVGGRVFFKEQEFGRRLTAGALIVGGVFLIIWMHQKGL